MSESKSVYFLKLLPFLLLGKASPREILGRVRSQQEAISFGKNELKTLLRRPRPPGIMSSTLHPSAQATKGA